MTTDPLPADAIEAARQSARDRAGSTEKCQCLLCFAVGGAAAALPSIEKAVRAKIAEEIEALVVSLNRHDPYTEAITTAAKIARGSSS